MISALGPVQAACLAVIAGEPDGLTAAAAAALLDRSVISVREAVARLEKAGYVRVLRSIPRPGKPEPVWGVTTAGRAALAAREAGTP